MSQPRIITDNSTLYTCYQELQAGDIVLGSVRLRQSEEFVLLDLMERGVQMIPSALAQLASRAKTFQVRLFDTFMAPHTLAIHDLHDMTRAITLYQKHSIHRVVTKHDRKNAGQGTHLWSSAEDVYSQTSFGVIPFPFVLQPFCPDYMDIRVVLLGDYLEAYWRHNAFNFRNNLHHGGESAPYTLSEEQYLLCDKVMKRGHFPYAHIDLMITAGKPYLAEINLRGGIRGARINQKDYRAKIETIHQRYLNKILSEGEGA